MNSSSGNGHTPALHLQPRHVVMALAYLAAAAAGWVVAYGFGLRASGNMWMGVLAAVNGAVFCTLLVDAVLSRWMKRRRAN
jgi:apolipoprotein N-acyltransferase